MTPVGYSLVCNKDFTITNEKLAALILRNTKVHQITLPVSLQVAFRLASLLLNHVTAISRVGAEEFD